MQKTVTQHASIAAESVNGVNQHLLATLAKAGDVGPTRLKDAYEATTSLKLLAQRLTLTAKKLQQLVEEWHQAGNLRTATAIDTDTVVADFGSAMTAADKAALSLFIALDHATKSLAPIGWQESAPPSVPHE